MSTSGNELAYLRYPSISEESSTTYLKSLGTGLMGLSGVKVKRESSRSVGDIHIAAYELNRRRSRSSVILPPYCTSDTMYCTVGHEMAPL